MHRMGFMGGTGISLDIFYGMDGWTGNSLFNEII